MNDRKKHDGSIPEDLDDMDFELPPVFAAAKQLQPVPEIIKDDRSLDAEQYGPAVLQLLEHAAFADMGEFVEWDDKRGVRVKSSKELTPLQRRLVKKVKEEKDGSITLELVDKDAALKLLGQASGVLTETKTINGNMNLTLIEVLKQIDGQSRGLPSMLPPPPAKVLSDD